MFRRPATALDPAPFPFIRRSPTGQRRCRPRQSHLAATSRRLALGSLVLGLSSACTPSYDPPDRGGSAAMS
ncbi:MAG: hypothetical protein MI919_24265, partial [Holophagales bacterium]|nr:hypothetical protein [Holophagales bacterium]